MNYKVAGIDVHKKVLIVAVAELGPEDLEFECRRFGTTYRELNHMGAWLAERGVQEVIMESTAQYWKPVWLELEQHFQLHLAQAQSNKAPKGRKHDFADTRRLVRRYVAGELILSYVPDAEQRNLRTLTRHKVQLTRDKVRLQSQLESLLEEMRIKLSSVISDLLGASGRRILRALACGEEDPSKLAALGDDRLKCTRAQLRDALTGSVEPMHRELLGLYLDRRDLLDRQMQTVTSMAAAHLKQSQDAVVRLAELPGLGVESAQQILAEVGPRAAAFESAGQLASWVGVCPGREESAGYNHNPRTAKGNKYMRRVLNQAAQAAVKKKNSYLQTVFGRLLVRLGYNKAIWAIAHRLCVLIWKILHEGVRFIERGAATTPEAAKRRAQKLMQALRKLGYSVEIKPTQPATMEE
jgi:transposase